uniref:Alcohol dehydrogenase-like C-terminal domain-containing protein n=1 Tax=Eutreptiella gymnastica TaxID=73025 RepID=A0A7S4FQV2_9EUGL
MQAAAVTQFDTDQIGGLYGSPPLPSVAGVSGVGIVTEDKGKFKEGDHAIIAAPTGCWASYVAADEATLIKVPSSIPVEYASTFVVGPMVAYRILQASGLKAGDHMVLSGANGLIGASVLQMAKSRGIHAVGIVNRGPHQAMQLEKLKQMGLDVCADNMYEIQGMFGNSCPKVAVSLVGGSSSAYLAQLLAEDGHIFTCTAASDKPQIIPSADLAAKNITIQGFSPFKYLQAEAALDKDAMVSEIAGMIEANQLKATVVRCEFDNLFTAIDQASAGVHNFVLMHSGTEKTWANRSGDSYMAIDQQLQENWDTAQAAQDPYLKSGREQPWDIVEGSMADAISPQLAAKFAGVSTEEELMAAIEALSFEEKRQLGLPDLEPVVLTPKELKQAVAELKQQ